MPELPEVEIVRRHVLKWTRGKRVLEVDAALVGERRHIMRMRAVEHKADGGAAVRLRSNQVQSGNFRQSFQGVGGEAGVVFEDGASPGCADAVAR